MAIFQRQYQKILAHELLRYLLLGKLPNVEQVSKRVGAILGKGGNITYQFISQGYKGVFNNRLYNKALNHIKFDIDTFYEELLFLSNDALERLNYADLYHKVHSYELSKLEAELNAILFTIQDADFYFLGAFDTFTDTSKTNITESTTGVVDLSEKALAIPYGARSSKRINTSHLINTTTWPVDILAPDSSQVISSSLVNGTKFGNIFIDTISSWLYDVRTKIQGPVKIRIRFPLAGSAESESEVFVNRLELITHSASKQGVLVRVSTDNVNYIPLAGYEEPITLSDQKLVYGLDFETNLVQYVELTFSKESADQEVVINNEKQYQYLFGLKNLSAFYIGRLQSARYQSKPFTFSDQPISRVSIQATEARLPGTSTNYAVAIADSSGNLLSSFIPITPINYSAQGTIGKNQVINFGSSVLNTNRLTIPSSGPDTAVVYSRPFQGKNFYRIGNALPSKPIFGSAKLYRGYKSWYRDASSGFQIIDMNDNYVSFEHTDLESIYTTTTEVPSYYNFTGTDNILRTNLGVSKIIYYDGSRGHILKPQPGAQSYSSDIKPNYAIYSVRQYSATRSQNIGFTMSNSRTQILPSSNFIIQSTDPNELPKLTASEGTLSFDVNRDYIIEVEEVSGRSKPTGIMTIPDGSKLIDESTGNIRNLFYKFAFTNDSDVTHKVSKIDGNSITLQHSFIKSDDTLEVIYRYIPTAPSEIIKASIRVSNQPSSSRNRIFYVEGSDYVIDPTTGAIQRIPTGSISNKGSVYVQFSFRDAKLGIETFQTWCNITNPDGVQIKFDLDSTTKKNKLVSDDTIGEGLFVNSSQGLITLTNAASTPVLGPGWVQFIVRSKNPDANVQFRSNLIDQVIQIRDTSKKKIFRENSSYFQEIIAFREPLIQRTLNHLRTNTLLSDHSVFAIDDITDPIKIYPVINFFPTSTSELYLRVPTTDSDETTRPSLSPEEFLLSWESLLSSNISGSQVIVRIDLSRNADSDGGLTPKVFDYTVRAG